MSGLDSLLRRQPPSAWERFCSSPSLFIARTLYSNVCLPLSEPEATTVTSTNSRGKPSLIRIVCISDTHSTHSSQPALPDGDILIHAGDLTHSGTPTELSDALSWLSAQPHAHKIVIAGNHDTALADPIQRTSLLREHASDSDSLVYLEDEDVTLLVRGRSVRVYGSPRTPRHGSWAFQYPRVRPGGHSTQSQSEFDLDVWGNIPTLTDVLVTHGPPFSHLDLNGAGCHALLAALWRIRPRLHVFGHIHGARGVEHVRWSRAQKAYEDVCAGQSAWGGLVRLVFWSVVERFNLLWKTMGDRGREEGTIMVNAAVGGVRDEQRRGAIVVQI
ncbi:metallophosphoesterase domain-containing protein 1 [Stereum hirsutum FP-91666 SS1]|uniref:metallophosphoesterase domain-containing protein 1 n=1 Tax=Stereum hirsutum (strain FP-91666) TaxID=721885 RepID=UPI000444A8C4|nr:metallophosphoesterase domain-containing protein 1 [Stereum hirsutum FP-91666 SS1]EIM82068.1 metallophosphoesterase domain-containing protein 1 [Stereum hirsutum FP-91666 SS1]